MEFNNMNNLEQHFRARARMRVKNLHSTFVKRLFKVVRLFMYMNHKEKNPNNLP